MRAGGAGPAQLHALRRAEHRGPARLVFQRGGKRFNVHVGDNLTFDHAECLVAAASAGTAVIQISSYVTGDALRDGLLTPILRKFEVDSPGMWVLYPQNRHLTPRVRAFVDFLVAAAHEIIDEPHHHVE